MVHICDNVKPTIKIMTFTPPTNIFETMQEIQISTKCKDIYKSTQC